MDDKTKKGGISVDSEHIFPIIKKWLYSEKEIFLREIVSNSSDAITKMKRLVSLGEVHDLEDENYRIDVVLDPSAQTLTVSDNGIGMSADELEKYICNIAMSGAVEFIQKYEKDDSGKPQEGIIGHFGLGFYSAFMISDVVTVRSKSYSDAEAVLWVCNSDGDYELSQGEREARGTDVIMHISDDEKDYLTSSKVREILDKYCEFMPIPIYFRSTDEKEEDKHDGEEEEHEEHEDGCECEECKHEPKEEKPINDTTPLWNKAAGDCTDEEYIAFYKKVFKDYRDPLFWVHINAEYPLNFRGIIYFPKLNARYESLEGQIKLYYNQVFVADNIKEVIPDFLLMLRGVLDCPELPLNVSRSYLQNNGYVKKISAHIVKKVGDRLNSMFNLEREKYEGLYEDIKPFIEYGCIRDSKFFERVKGSILFKCVSGDKKVCTLDEYLEGAKEKHENKVYYATDKETQIQYITMFENEGIQLLLLDHILDPQFITTIEQSREGVKFIRVDADVAGALKGEGEAESSDEITSLLRKAAGNDELPVTYAKLKDEKTPAILNADESERRFSDMMKLYSNEDASGYTAKAELVVNTSSAVYGKVKALVADGKNDEAEKVCKRIYSLALLASRRLTADELKKFLDESYDLLSEID